MVQFERLIIHQFGSIVKPLEIRFNNKGLTRITGKNGAGKTTLLSALSWCLYGQTLKKKSSIEPWPGLSSKEGAYVEIWLSVNDLPYRIERCSNWREKISDKVKGGNRLQITDDDGPVYIKGKAKQNEIVKETLGMSFDVFKNTVVFGQQMERFMREDGPMKKKILEEILDISYINRAKEKCEKEISDISRDLQKIIPKFFSCTADLNTLKNEYINQVKYLKAFDEDKKKKLDNLLEERADLMSQYEFSVNKEDNKDFNSVIKKLNIKCTTLKKDIEKLSNLENEQFKYQMWLDGVNNDKEVNNRELMALNNYKLKTTCPECGNKLSEKQVKELKEKASVKRKKYIEKNLSLTLLKDGYTTRLSTLKSDIGKLSNVKIEYENCLSKLKIVKAKREANELLKVNIANLENNLKKLDENILKVKQEKPLINNKNILHKIKEVEVRLEQITLEKETHERKIEERQWLIKEPLSNKGLKVFIFTQMIGLINQALEKYENLLPFKVHFEIKQESANKDFMIHTERNGNKTPYDDLSGGQKQLVDISIAFAINDVFSLDNPVNIIAFDEVFENLDADNIDIIKDTLIGKSSEKHVLLISHQDSLAITHCEEIRFVQDKLGRSMVK